MCPRPNLLILDEPTNHLDIETIGALGDSIKTFNGGVVLVSHDERLISAVCTECWVCSRAPITASKQSSTTLLDASRVSVLPGGLEEYKKVVRSQLDLDLVAR